MPPVNSVMLAAFSRVGYCCFIAVSQRNDGVAGAAASFPCLDNRVALKRGEILVALGRCCKVLLSIVGTFMNIESQAETSTASKDTYSTFRHGSENALYPRRTNTLKISKPGR